jgi:hypothetical protein
VRSRKLYQFLVGFFEGLFVGFVVGLSIVIFFLEVL